MSDIGAIKDREYSKFIASPSRGAPFTAIEVNPQNATDNPLFVDKVISKNTLIEYALQSGILKNDTFDKVVYGVAPSNLDVLTFYNEGVILFQLVLDFKNQSEFQIYKRPALFNLLQSQGDKILIQPGNGELLIQGLLV